MNISTYFLKHPVITLVVNSMIIVTGFLCFNSLNVREYPEIHFPKVEVSTTYPNASAELIENNITNPLEDKLAGVEGIETITSNSEYGQSNISLTFKKNISIDKALSAIREAVSLVGLPEGVKMPRVEKQTTANGMPFIIISLESSTMDFAELTHYANLNLKNGFRSLEGVASAEVWGQPYIYNIILDAKKIYSFGINVDEIYDALSRSNSSLPAGKFQNEIPVTLNNELKTIKDYENLLIREKNPGKPAIFLKNVANIELKTDDTKFRVRINGKAGLCIGINKANDANPLEVSKAVRTQLKAANLPVGLKMNLISDQAEFIRYSLKNIESSIVEAVILVLIVVFLFLRNLKATLIPLVTIPISLIGSFLFLKIFGFSINILTLLAMVLSIGIVVDDAIVVLENIQRHVDKGLSPFEASLKGSKEISFAIIAMTLTLVSVYIPLAFTSGMVGDLFIEFAVALAGSVLISGIVALILSPLMCSRILKKHSEPLWPKIDKFLDDLTSKYESILRKILLYKKTCLFIIFSIFALIILFAKIIKSETAPKEDRNLIGLYISSIAGKDINAMEEKLKIIEATVKDLKEAEHRLVMIGSWGGNIILPLKMQSMRKRSAEDIVGSLRPIVSRIPSLDVYPWSWDSGLPNTEHAMGEGAISLVISTGESYLDLFKTVEKVQKSLEQQSFIAHHDLKLDNASYRIDLDNNEIMNLNLNYRQIAKTIEVFFSGDQSLNFTKDGLMYSVLLKGNKSPWDLFGLYVTNKLGKRISLGAVASLIPVSGPNKLFHYNQMRSLTLTTDLPQGENFSKGKNKFFDIVNKDLPPSFKKTWTGNAKAHGESSGIILFSLALIFIFAILSIQFESFIDPFIILLTVPLACFGGLGFIWIFNGSFNIYTQIGLITLVGLITKHGILIVEFANSLRKEKNLDEAIIKAASLRLRPILMTSLAMIFGGIPLIISHDAGHETRQAIGIVLVGGLSIGTIFTLFILPTLYHMIKSLEGKEILLRKN